MATTIVLEDQAARALEVLRAQAAASGQTLGEYLQALGQMNDSRARTGESTRSSLTAQAFAEWLRELTTGMPDVPPLPADFGRADLYSDHD